MDSSFLYRSIMPSRQATALPTILFPLLWIARYFAIQQKNTRILQKHPICKILPTSRSQVSGNGILKRTNSRAMQHLLAIRDQSKEIRQAQDWAFGTTTALRTAEVWELWKLWRHQRRCAPPTALWSHKWCGGPLSLLSPQECRRTSFGSCQIHFVWQIC